MIKYKHRVITRGLPKPKKSILRAWSNFVIHFEGPIAASSIISKALAK